MKLNNINFKSNLLDNLQQKQTVQTVSTPKTEPKHDSLSALDDVLNQ